MRSSRGRLGSAEPGRCVWAGAPVRSGRAGRSDSWRSDRPAPAIGAIEASPLRSSVPATSRRSLSGNPLVATPARFDRPGRSLLARIEQAPAPPSADKQGPGLVAHGAWRPTTPAVALVATSGEAAGRGRETCSAVGTGAGRRRRPGGLAGATRRPLARGRRSRGNRSRRVPVCAVMAARPHMQLDMQGVGELLVGGLEVGILRADVQP
jgi:hypothetical protein